jgi:hypothetical protein
MQLATQQVHIAKKQHRRRNLSPNPSLYGSWISREIVERWIDPKGSNPKSCGHERKPSEPRLNQTGSGAYKTPNLPVQSISYVHFSLFSHPSERNSHFSPTNTTEEVRWLAGGAAAPELFF